MDPMGDVEMMAEEDTVSPTAATVSFQLQLDKPIPTQIVIAEWNPEKDLLAMVTEDSKLFLHRFNWQKLWTVSPGKVITSLCWRPDGKMIAIGLDDGSILLHDVENGKLLRSIRSHNSAVVCLTWQEEDQSVEEENNTSHYEDRTPHFFPSAPRIPQMPGLSSGDSGHNDDLEDTFGELSCNSHKRFNILCSGDINGEICFSIFGIFLIGKINIRDSTIQLPSGGKTFDYILTDVSLHKLEDLPFENRKDDVFEPSLGWMLSLSRDLCRLTILTFGCLTEKGRGPSVVQKKDNCYGMHCLNLNTSIFHLGRNELYQVALQASSIEDLIEVIHASLSVMQKQWSDAMSVFHEKFDPIVSSIVDHGIDSTPEEEFMSFLLGSRSSAPINQFLVHSISDMVLKRVMKAVEGAGKEMNVIIREHLQPAAEIIGFRVGELRGLSRWRSRYLNVGLDEKAIDYATEKASLLLVQVERFLRILAIVAHEVQNFLKWLMKTLNVVLPDSSVVSVPQSNIELVVTFLKFHYEHDPVKHFMEASEVHGDMELDRETIRRIEELKAFGGFLDAGYLRRTLAKEIAELESSFIDAFAMPFSTISERICCENLFPLFPISDPPNATSLKAPSSVSYYKGETLNASPMDYMCIRTSPDSSDTANSIGIIKRVSLQSDEISDGTSSFEYVVLRIPDDYECVDLSLYKDGQIVLLLNEKTQLPELSGHSCMMIIQADNLPFKPLSECILQSPWKIHGSMASTVDLDLKYGRLRSIPHTLTSPLAVSASRGLACVFTRGKHALVYILDEDEDEEEEE